ncbi:MAG: transcription factor S [Candidatus Thermoplasmatota archaeon]|nr:transcription factor S [Candidatus Thermoplasmatota archaeon]
MFCPKCKSLMYPVGGKMMCKKCGYCAESKPKTNAMPVAPAKIEAKATLNDGRKSSIAAEKKAGKSKVGEDIPIFEGTLADTLPIERVECSKCGNTEAYWYLLQTRKADEAETRFYQCTKCGHKWREY